MKLSFVISSLGSPAIQETRLGESGGQGVAVS